MESTTFCKMQTNQPQSTFSLFISLLHEKNESRFQLFGCAAFSYSTKCYLPSAAIFCGPEISSFKRFTKIRVFELNSTFPCLKIV